MSRIHTATSGIGEWRARLADPVRQWRRGYSAFEMAVSWEDARRSTTGLPPCVEDAFRKGEFGPATLLIGVAEHKVRLRGRGGGSQCDLWGLLMVAAGQLSLSIEGKAREPFGNGNESLSAWLSRTNKASLQNRAERWQHVQQNLPPEAAPGAFTGVAFQLLHRCATAVIEARRFGIGHATFLVQAFNAPDDSFAAYAALCAAVGVPAARGEIHAADAGDVRLGIGWVDCPLATDAQVARVA